MSTNYYAVIDSEELFDEVDDSIEVEWKTPIECSILCKKTTRQMVIHIGSKSYGWAFHFFGNESSKWFHSPSSWFEFLETFKPTIIDEYGELVFLEELKEIVFKYGAPKGLVEPSNPGSNINKDHYDHCMKQGYTSGIYKSEGYSFSTRWFA